MEVFVLHAIFSQLRKVTDTEELTTFEGVWGEMHVEYDVVKKRLDISPIFRGLPNDSDPCPHWGLVVKGQMSIVNGEKTEVVKAGEAYYAAPWHTGVFEAGTELWSFSPNDKFVEVLEAINRNMAALMKAASTS